METDGLVLAAQTVGPGTTLRDRAEAAAAAGFTGLGLRPRDRREALAAGETDAGIRALLGDHGLAVVELEAIRDWGATGEAAGRSRAFEDTVYALADAVGGRYVVAVGEIEGPPDAVAERFTALCARAAGHGLAVAIEFVPFTTIPDAATAWRIVRDSGAPNGGVLADAWHHYRGSAEDAQLRAIPPERILAVQIDDADAQVRGTLADDTRHHRRVPGEGAFPLAEFVRLLDGHGVRLPYSVEVLSDELHALPAAEAARRAAAATRRVLAEARS